MPQPCGVVFAPTLEVRTKATAAATASSRPIRSPFMSLPSLPLGCGDAIGTRIAESSTGTPAARPVEIQARREHEQGLHSRDRWSFRRVGAAGARVFPDDGLRFGCEQVG